MKKIIFISSFLILFIFSRAQNNALHFDGFGDDVGLPYTNALDFSLSSKFTIEGWFKTTANTAVIFSNIVDSYPFTGYEVAVVNSKLVFSQSKTDLTDYIRIETINSVNDGDWHHFACVYKGIPNATMEDIYVDGTLQQVFVNGNNLTTSFSSGNAPHIGSRNNTTYFTDGTLDEIRIWKKDLCAAEIRARKNCQLLGNEALLLAYFDCNQGIASGNNNGINFLPDVTGNGANGVLTGFSLNGPISNWVSSNSLITGTCAAITPISIAGNTIICLGNSNTFTVNGATSYTWSTQANTASILVSPTVTTTYSVSTTSANCDNTAFVTLTVSKCTALEGIKFSGKEITISPNPSNGRVELRGAEKGTIVNVYDITGMLVYSLITDSIETQIDLLDLSNGIYVLRGTSVSKETFTRKIIKE